MASELAVGPRVPILQQRRLTPKERQETTDLQPAPSPDPEIRPPAGEGGQKAQMQRSGQPWGEDVPGRSAPLWMSRRLEMATGTTPTRTSRPPAPASRPQRPGLPGTGPPALGPREV